MDVRIGITTSFNEGEQRLDRAYVVAVERAGGTPLIVPMVASVEATERLAQLLDGLIVTGGPAITQGLVGTLPEEISETDAVRIAADGRILDAFLRLRRPVLGICYGMQLLNARAGGTLLGDVEHQREGALPHSQQRGAADHGVTVVPGTHLARLLSNRPLTVNTRHLQAVETVGAGFRVAATAPDGVVEAIENEDGTVLGVQFHPERMGAPMLPLFRHLVDRARATRHASEASP